jgi:hypothetical protein
MSGTAEMSCSAESLAGLVAGLRAGIGHARDCPAGGENDDAGLFRKRGRAECECDDGKPRRGKREFRGGSHLPFPSLPMRFGLRHLPQGPRPIDSVPAAAS